jgi:hypothetical protein
MDQNKDKDKPEEPPKTADAKKPDESKKAEEPKVPTRFEYYCFQF